MTDYKLITFDWSGTLSQITYAFDLSAGETSDLFPCVKPTLEALHEKGFLLAIATMLPKSALAQELTSNGISDFFVTTRTASDCHAKPHPGMLQEIMEFCGVEAHETLMVGDTVNDYQMAENAGVDSAIIVGDHHYENPPRFEIQSIEDLLAFV